MALPKINETLNFNMKVPSTGKTVKYRPYLVKEEKILLQAFESGDVKTCLEAMVSTLDACIDPKSKVEVGSLATFDIEYLFTQVRAKSVGESSRILIKCKGCGEDNPQDINLEDLKVEVEKNDNVIDINDELSVEMKYPTYNSFIEQDINVDNQDTESLFAMLASSISAVLTENERIACEKESKESVVEFLNSMTASQLQKVVSFLEKLPALKHEVKFDCSKCGEHNEIELKGLSDFF